jgi:hypothetical protein
MSKISIRFFDDREVRAVWDEENSKEQVAEAVNSTMTMLYWQVGNRIKTDILQTKRAEYGKEVIRLLAANLTKQYGKGWSEKQLRHCLHIVETFPDIQIVYTLCRQLTRIQTTSHNCLTKNCSNKN